MSTKKTVTQMNWAELQDSLRKQTKDSEVNAMIEEEKAGKARKTFLHRLYNRYSKLRRKREEKVIG